MSKLHEISSGGSKPRGAVIFMHGLNAMGKDDHHFATWRRGEDEQTFWPRWVAADYPDVAVHCLEYASHASRWTGESMELYERSSDILAEFIGRRIDRFPLLFVCHSLGGLVAKQLLRDSSDDEGNENGEIFKRTRGVAFYATPHAGADLAKTMDRFRWFARPTQSIKDLLPNSKHLLNLNNWYINKAFRQGIGSLVFYETKNFPKYGDVIVDLASATLGGVGSRPIPVEDCDHNETCCPLDRTRNTYTRLTRFLEDHLFKAVREVPVRAEASSEDRRRAEEAERQIVEALKSEGQDAEARSESVEAARFQEALAAAELGQLEQAAAVFAAIEQAALAEAAPARRRASEAARLEALALFGDSKAKALARLEAAVENDPANEPAWWDLLDTALLAGVLPKARRAVERLIVLTSAREDERDLSISYERLGGILEAEGNLTGARKAYEDGLAISKRLAEADATNAQGQRDLSVSYNKLGGILEAEGNLTGARKAYEDGLAISKRLAEADATNAQGQRDLSISYERLGGILEAEGNLTGARKAYEDGLAISKRLAEADATNAQGQRDLSISYERLGGILEAEGNLTGARKAYEDGLAIRKRLAEADATNAQGQRDLSISYERLGGILEAEGNLTGARKAYEDGLAISKRLAEADATNAQGQRDLSVSYNKLGGILEAEGNLTGARKAYEDGLAIRKRLAEADATNAQGQRDLSVSYNKLGGILEAEGNLTGARKAYEDGLAIRKRLAEADATNAQGQRDLSISYERLGGILEAEGNLTGARKAYEDGLAIRKRLAEADATHMGRQADLVISHMRIALLGGDAACAHLKAADAIATMLKTTGALTAQQAGWPEVIRARMKEAGCGS